MSAWSTAASAARPVRVQGYSSTAFIQHEVSFICHITTGKSYTKSAGSNNTKSMAGRQTDKLKTIYPGDTGDKYILFCTLNRAILEHVLVY